MPGGDPGGGPAHKLQRYWQASASPWLSLGLPQVLVVLATNPECHSQVAMALRTLAANPGNRQAMVDKGDRPTFINLPTLAVMPTFTAHPGPNPSPSPSFQHGPIAYPSLNSNRTQSTSDKHRLVIPALHPYPCPYICLACAPGPNPVPPRKAHSTPSCTYPSSLPLPPTAPPALRVRPGILCKMRWRV